ncbi:MAG: hypothetical protein JW821_15425 [Deltaproteobacteria bacterium]|nr:hypothetical protein [Deltaproteobacteria bacterium]
MRFYVYYDSYRRPRRAISESELAETYGGDTEAFLKAMWDQAPDSRMERGTGSIGTLSFDSERDLRDYLESIGEEVTGFFEAKGDCRPFNF